MRRLWPAPSGARRWRPCRPRTSRTSKRRTALPTPSHPSCWPDAAAHDTQPETRMLQTGHRRPAEALPEPGRKAGAGARSWSDWSLSSVTAGFLAVLVSFTGPLAIFYQAAQAAQVDSAGFASWVWGISIGAAVSG